MMEYGFSYTELNNMNIGELLLYNKEVSNMVDKKNRDAERQNKRK
tara:strand:- start:179 stop:313 length:135 start_codon:yes stop_codon:yes gene_type:complete